MKPIQVLTTAILLFTVTLICYLVFVCLPSLYQQKADSHSASQLDIPKKLTSSVHDKDNMPPAWVNPPFDVHIMSMSDSFRKAIPLNGAYWNRMLNSVMRSLDKGEYTFSKNNDNCRETNQDVLQNNVHDFRSYPEMHQEFLRSFKCRHPPMLIDQPNKCSAGEGDGDGLPFLLFAIKSVPRNFEQRQVIRETWGREGVYERGLRVRRLFLLGSSMHDDPNLSQLLSFEAKVFGDVLQWDFHDSLFNLSLKEHVFYKWSLNNCPHVAFVFKGDDDVFINTQAMLTYLQSLNGAQAVKSYIGRVITSASPIRSPESKYYIPQTLYEGPYPPYLSGGGYLFSGALLRPLYYISNVIPFFPIDDAYTGMCFQALGISPVQHSGFRTFDVQKHDRENNCVHKDVLAIHPRNPQQVKRLWRGIHSPLLTC